MRLLGLPIEPPQAIVSRVLSDLGAVARAARAAPAQLDRVLELGAEMASIGRAVLEVAERLDRRAEAVMLLGERLDGRANDLLTLGGEMRELGDRIDFRGSEIVELGNRIDDRGGEIVDSARRVAETGGELISVLPALERAIQMTTPLEGAIDRFGRLVDRLPGGGTARRRVVPRPVGPVRPTEPGPRRGLAKQAPGPEGPERPGPPGPGPVS